MRSKETHLNVMSSACHTVIEIESARQHKFVSELLLLCGGLGCPNAVKGNVLHMPHCKRKACQTCDVLHVRFAESCASQAHLLCFILAATL
jgi:hypothetical protein